MLVADLPVIGEGRFSGPEMVSPDRLWAINAQIVEWQQRFDQVARFPYRDTLEAAEAERPQDPIRSDGTHPDIEPLAELARAVYVPTLIELVASVRADIAGPVPLDR